MEIRTALFRLFFVLLLFPCVASALVHPDDTYWDSRFSLPGVSGSLAARQSGGEYPPKPKVQALATYSDMVFVGGDFTLPGNFIVAWSTLPGKWDTLNGGVNGVVSACCIVGDDLYVGGSFTRAGTVAVQNIARWNIPTRTWSEVGGGVNGEVRCLTASGTTIYAAGKFSVAGSVGANNIACWDGVQWSALGSGGNNGISGGNFVNDLLVFQNKLYVAMSFGFAGADTSNRELAVWDGSSWSNMARFSSVYDNSTLFGPAIYALAEYKGTLIVGGSFDSVGTTRAAGLVQWDGAQWRALDSIGGFVQALCVDGDNLYVGGSFSRVSKTLANNIAIRNMATGKWSTAGSGTGTSYFDVVSVLHQFGSDIYAGGTFRIAGSVVVNCIARWRSQPKEWAQLAEQAPAGVCEGRVMVTNLVRYNGGLVAAGDFALAGNIVANGIAVWNDHLWSPASGGLAQPEIGVINTATAHGDKLYVGGVFSGIGGSTAKYVAQYDGTLWKDIGMPGGSRATDKWPVPWPEIHVLYHDGTRLYMGGEFTTIGSVSANCIAEWDGSQWKALGSGVQNPNMYVYTITKNNAGTLYAGGDFDVMGGVTTGGLAQWDGSQWKAVGGVLNGSVRALATDGSDLYVGGTFLQAGGRVVNNIARWDGSQWHDLDGGAGMNGGVVNALLVHNHKLYAAGKFKTMGGLLTSVIAVWDIQSGRWEQLGSGIDGVVYALAEYNNDIYVAGNFMRAGGKFSCNIARWSKPTTSSIGADDAFRNLSFGVSPNPALETTAFSFATGSFAPVLLTIVDILGREVARPFSGVLPAGQHSIPCPVGSLSAGVYTAVLVYGERRETLRMVVGR